MHGLQEMLKLVKRFYKMNSLNFEGTVIQIEKTQVSSRLRVSKLSWNFHIPTTYNIAVIY